MSNRRDRYALVALALVAALIGAPASRVARNQCDLCPPTCPMHHPEHVQPSKPSCHGVEVAAAHHGAERAHTGAPALSRPPCRDAGGTVGSAPSPMMLTTVPHAWHPSEPDGLRGTDAAAPDRAADPPESPPPIALV